MKRHSKKIDIATLLKNKNILYVVLFFALLNLFSYLMLKQLDAVAFFIIIGFLTTYFSKNMIIVMLTAMISTFLLVQINMLGNVQEGFDASGNSMSKTEDAATPAAETEATKEATTETTTKEEPVAPVIPTMPAPKAAAGLTGDERAKATAVTSSTTTEKFSQPITPARYSSLDDDDTPRHKPKIDYAATLETAYDNLDKLLSSDAIRNMSADTGRLAEKQQQLMGNIEKITPIMEKAGSILQGFDMGAITKLMKNVGGSVNMLKENRPEMETE